MIWMFWSYGFALGVFVFTDAVLGIESGAFVCARQTLLGVPRLHDFVPGVYGNVAVPCGI